MSVLKEKLCGKLKGRVCTDGHKYEMHKTKAEIASHAAHAGPIVVAALVDVHDRRDADSADVPGACLNATMDEFVLLKMVDEQVYVLMNIEHSYVEHAACEKLKKVV